MSEQRRSRWAIVIAVLASLAVLAPSFAVASSPEPIDDIRLAKIGLSVFLLEHIDRPTRISEQCPSVPADVAAAKLRALGLEPSGRDYGAAIVFDTDVGGGLVALRCGVDIAASADPPDSIGLSTDVTLLDGQATFNQYAVELGGRDVVIGTTADPEGRIASRCTNGGRDCAAALWVDDLVVTVRMRRLPADTGEQLARRLAVALAPEIIANLAAHGRAATDR